MERLTYRLKTGEVIMATECEGKYTKDERICALQERLVAYDDYFYCYGGRGITVCDEWNKNFQSFYSWAMENGYSDGLTIDRKDVAGGYCPDNCRFVTMKEQQSNKRNNVFVHDNGDKITLAEVARRYDISELAAWKRFHSGNVVCSVAVDRRCPVMRDDGEIYESMAMAANANGTSNGKISAVCKGKRKKVRGHRFRKLTREEAEKALRRGEDA